MGESNAWVVGHGRRYGRIKNNGLFVFLFPTSIRNDRLSCPGVRMKAVVLFEGKDAVGAFDFLVWLDQRSFSASSAFCDEFH
jgi:hypothetical protein